MIETTKNTSMPVGAAIARLVRLAFAKRFIKDDNPTRDREIEKLIDALNAFEVNLAFDCSEDATAEIKDTLAKAESALDVLLCDAQTDCCRIIDKEAAGSQGRKFTSSRGD